MGHSAQDEAAQHAGRTAAVVAQLRGKIRALEAQPRQLLLGLRTGVRELDALGVFRLGTGVELTGEEASGRTTLALAVVAGACREKRLAAWVDGPAQLYPPAALSLGVELERLLIVRPPAPGQLVWAAVQLLRSGAFACVVLDLAHTGLVLSLTETKKLLDAARTGGALLLLVTAREASAQGLVRLTLRQRREGRRIELSHLRCLEGGAAMGPEYELEAPHGRRVRVARAGLARGAQVPLRRAQTVGAGPPLVLVAAAVSLQRLRKNRERDGYVAGGPRPIVHGRPGRDTPLRVPARSWR
jgi:recombination protein RecA